MKRLGRLAGIPLLLVACGGFALAQDDPASPPPGPRRGIDGIGGVQTESEVLFEGPDTRPHVLSCTYVFPDRARWRIHARDGRASARELFFRFGERAWKVAEGSNGSTEFEGWERDKTLLQMELRRAVLLFPHGFTWSERERGGDRRRAPVYASSAEGRPFLGTLIARQDEDGLHSMRAVDGEGNEVEELEVVSWQEQAGRRWPRELVLSQDGRVVWRETIREVVTQLHYLDLWFQPTDTRASGTALVAGRLVHTITLSPITYRLHALEEGTAWEEALARAGSWIAEAKEELEGRLEVDPIPSFELDDQARPVRCVVRLVTAQSSPPEGWTTRWDMPGLAVALDGLPELDAGMVSLLRRAAPAGERGGTPYCRVPETGVQLYLPLEEGDP